MAGVAVSGRKIAITGAGSGIGAATRSRLEAAGHEVLGVDLRNAEVEADLSTDDGRAAAVAAVESWCGGRLDGLVPCAGVGPQVPGDAVVRINYFGAVAVTDGLRPALSHGTDPSVVVIASNGATTTPGVGAELVDACLAGDEVAACAAVSHPAIDYGAAKLALSRWVRRQAPGPRWAGMGIRLNAVAPGATQTPLLQGGLDDPQLGPAIEGFPIPIGARGEPDDIAVVVELLLSAAARFVCGSIWYVDGGTDALLRGDDWPTAWQA